MEWSAPIDIYCERLAPGLWAEPLNLTSNLAFVIAAWLSTRWLRKHGVHDPSLWVLTALAFCIGVGSGLFHSVATLWSMWADIIPIAVFLFAYIGVLMRRLLALSWRRVAAAYAAFIAVSGLFIAYANLPALGGSHPYFGSAIALGTMALGVRRVSLEAARLYALAWFAFIASLTLRSIDLSVCASLPTGTHFLWHLLNAVVIALALRAGLTLHIEAETGAKIT